MTNESTQSVTPEEGNPTVDENGNPVAPVDQQGGTPPATAPTPPQPDEAYKGLQRTLEREKARARDLEARLQQVTSQPASAQDAQIVSALLTEIAQTNPERAAALGNAYQSYRLAAENQALRSRQQDAEQDRIYAEAQERNTRELRETARAFGADPDSPLIDYGDPDTESIADRLARVRVSATAAARPTEQAVVPQARSAADGTQHNTQAGAPPAAITPRGNTVTEEQLHAAQDRYARTYHTMDGAARAKADAELRDLTDRFAAQVFA